jgi:hypothetical protein
MSVESLRLIEVEDFATPTRYVGGHGALVALHVNGHHHFLGCDGRVPSRYGQARPEREGFGLVHINLYVRGRVLGT